ncbi:UPF0280 family protein [Acetobacterium woodii]|uniref:Uncharacterized protein n=1 Tax=Acetobacterium woodii (strain ATCC 29683 / DSM 1030 / JCM 2381 / KCTC 1655 / WB1) TaxID=931626 RepID=H6LG77_ACEWD|nr:UPF0280 family protein [Acetobacterium woodii]AFA49553.1 hypothetical protein Awo_c28020 [Acetobacterium woodii DSM 1030]
MSYQARTYRKQIKAEDLEYFQILEFESDLLIGVDQALESQALIKVVEVELKKLRQIMIDYNQIHPVFFKTLTPMTIDLAANPIIRDMQEAGITAGVGPMAAVAGAISKYIGKLLAGYANEIVIENGGDLLVKTKKERRIALHTGNPHFVDLGLKITGREQPLGICTSSGTMGHSLSFGKADAVTILSENIPLADAAATALGNRIKKSSDVQNGLDWIKTIPGILGALIIIDDQLGAWGQIVLC